MLWQEGIDSFPSLSWLFSQSLRSCTGCIFGNYNQCLGLYLFVNISGTAYIMCRICSKKETKDN